MKETINYIKKVFNTEEFIPLHIPRFIGNEKQYLSDCIDSTYVSTAGKYVDIFEEKFAKEVGSKHAIAVVNGTSALHISLILANVTQKDEVLTQPLTFIATCNAISYLNASPVFIDVDLDTMGMSPKSLTNFLEKNCELQENKCINKNTNKQIKACVPMHTFGHPCRIDKIKTICLKWNITLIEDAAESLGSYYKNTHTGTFGQMGVFSFNGNKIITSGGGGVIVTDDEVLAKKAKHLTTTAKINHPYEYIHDEIGFNYRMPNINAALLIAQLEKLKEFCENKRELASIYKEFFDLKEKVSFIKEPKDAKSNYWLNALLFESIEEKQNFLEYSNNNQVMTRPIWKLINELEMYKNYQSTNLDNSKYLEQRVVNIPSSVRI